MQNNTSSATIADSYPLPTQIDNDENTFFEGLLAITHRATIDKQLGEQIKTYVQGWLAVNPLDRFSDYSDITYRRTYIGRSAHSPWEAIVMTWKQGNATSIHAHPQFAGYYFADGTFKIEIFESAAPGTAKLVQSIQVTGGAGFAAIGLPGHFDNHIHRITCLSPTGHSLHVYSDNALQGCKYELAEE